MAAQNEAHAARQRRDPASATWCSACSASPTASAPRRSSSRASPWTPSGRRRPRPCRRRPTTVPDARPLRRAARKALELTFREALRLGHNYIGTEHILLALLEVEDGTGVLAGLGVDKARAEADDHRCRGRQRRREAAAGRRAASDQPSAAPRAASSGIASSVAVSEPW